MRHYLTATTAAMLAFFTGTAFAQTADLFMLRTTSKSVDMVVEAIKSHSEQKKWVYLGASKVKVKDGEVTFVKLCIPAVGQQVWPQGLHLSALLPCGNVGVYAKGGATEISVLHPRYMHMLHPTPEMEKASATALPLMTEMLDAVTK